MNFALVGVFATGLALYNKTSEKQQTLGSLTLAGAVLRLASDDGKGGD